MKTTTSVAMLLVTALMTMGTPQLAFADPPPLGTAMGNLADIAGQLQKMSDNRATAQRERKQAQDELDALNKQGGGNNEQTAAIQKRIKDADDTVQRLDKVLEGKNKQKAEVAKGGANAGKSGPNSDLGRELEKLAAEREKAKTEREKAKADLDKMKQGSGGKEKTEALKKQIRDADEKIKNADKILGSTVKSVEFKATNEDEVKQAMKLPEIVQKVLGKFQVTQNMRITPTFNLPTKQGGVKIEWKGNP